MDPLTVTVSVASFLANCLTTVKVLSSLSSRYQHVLVTISSIVSETTYLGSYLAHVQQLLLMNAPSVNDTTPAGRELRHMFDIALTACLITFSCLEEEVRQLAVQTPQGAGPEWKERAKRLWKDEIMNEILMQIREQQSTMQLLVQTLQMYGHSSSHRDKIPNGSRQSVSASNHFLKENRSHLVATVSRSRALRQASFSNLKVPESIFEGGSLMVESGSTVGNSEFDFNDDVVNSTVYRRAMANVQRQHSLRGKSKRRVEAETDEELEAAVAMAKAESEAQPTLKESRSHPRLVNVKSVTEEFDGLGLDRNVMNNTRRRGNGSDSTIRPSRQQIFTADDDDNPVSPQEQLQASRVDTNSYRSADLSASSSFRSPDTSTSDISGGVVNFSRKPSLAEANALRTPDSFRTDSINDFYDDSSGHFAPIVDKEPAQVVPITRYAPSAAKRVEAMSQEANARRGIPTKAAKRLGVEERQHPRLSHIEEVPSKERPDSSTSAGSGSSRARSNRSVTQISFAELSRNGPLDFAQTWSAFWRVPPEDVRKPPRGYNVSLQEQWWRLLQLEEMYAHSLQMLHSLITSDNIKLPTSSITPVAIQKMQSSHDKYLRQPLREAMGVGPWTFEYAAIIKAYQLAHSHLVPLYERYSWDLPAATFQIAASSVPSAAASRDLLLSIGPGMPTRYTVLRSPLTHVCATFDTIQSIYDVMHKGGPKDVPNFAQILFPVREQIRSLIASCNRNVLLRWDDLRRSNLFGDNASRDIAEVTKELIFPPSQRKNIALLNLGSPTRAVIARADLHWKAKAKDSWSKCHAVLLNNYLILASMSTSKGQRQHQIYHLVSLAEIATTTMSAEPLDEKKAIKHAKAGKPVYHLSVRTPDFEHILGFATMVHCLEWHEHLDVALRGEMMDMPTGISGGAS